jgi:hypothetical protein
VTKLGSVLLLVLVLPFSLNAQDVAKVQALTVPARNVGTCFAHTVQRTDGHANAGTRTVLVIKLVIKSKTPGNSREISLFRDKAGTAAGYAEMNSVFNPPFASESDNIVASYRPDGSVSGTWTHLTIQMSDSGFSKLDSASLRQMRERAVHHSTRKPLDAADQERVRTLIHWVSRRCAA